MYAYVRFLDDNVFQVVNTDKIMGYNKNKIKLNTKKYQVMYMDGEYYDAVVVYVNDDLEDLNKQINSKRIRKINRDLLMSQSEDDGGATSDDVSTVPEKPVNINKTNIKKSLKKQNTDVNKQKVNVQNQIFAQFEARNEDDLFTKKKPHPQVIQQNKEEAILPKKHLNPARVITSSPETHPIEKPNTIIKNLEEKVVVLEEELATAKELISEKDEIINDLMKLNISLQKDVINKQKDVIKYIDSKIAQKEESPIMQKELEVGEMQGDKVHLGQGIYLAKVTFDSCFMLSKTGSQFVKNLAIAVFGVNVLKSSTVTGRPSNRKGDKEGRPPLDPTKLQAIYDSYRYYLIKKGTDDVKLGMELLKIGSYISSKITDMNREPKEKLNLKKGQSISCTSQNSKFMDTESDKTTSDNAEGEEEDDVEEEEEEEEKKKLLSNNHFHVPVFIF